MLPPAALALRLRRVWAPRGAASMAFSRHLQRQLAAATFSSSSGASGASKPTESPTKPVAATSTTNATHANEPQQQQESTNANDKEGGGAQGEESKEKYKPGFFSRNPGIVLAAIILSIGGYIYRGSTNKKNFAAVQNPIAEQSMISPYEAWELRSTNNITPEVYKQLLANSSSVFPSGKVTLGQFDRFLGAQLSAACPDGVNNVHHLERVLMGLKKDEQQMAPLDAYFVAFAMAIKGTVDERLECLFTLASGSNPDKTISVKQMKRLVDLLMQTFQIPSEKRVFEVREEKYPFQQYAEATPEELVSEALDDYKEDVEKQAKKGDGNELPAPIGGEGDDEILPYEAFARVMKGRMVCLWGECFAKGKKKRMNL